MSNISHLLGHHSLKSSLIMRTRMSPEIIRFIIKQAEGWRNSTRRGPTASTKALRQTRIIGMNLRTGEIPGGKPLTRQFIQVARVEKPAQASEWILWSTDQARAPPRGNYLQISSRGIHRSGHKTNWVESGIPSKRKSMRTTGANWKK